MMSYLMYNEEGGREGARDGGREQGREGERGRERETALDFFKDVVFIE